MVIALHVAPDIFRADNNRCRMTAQIPVDDPAMNLGFAVSVVNRNHRRDSSLPCSETPVKIGMVEVTMHQIYTLTPNKLNQSRHHSPVEPSLVHEAEFHQRNIHGGQLVANCSTLAYAAYDRCKAPVV